MVDTYNNIEEAVTGLRGALVAKLKKNNKTTFWVGAALAFIGILSLVFPQFSSLTVEIMVGWMLLFAGAFYLFNAFTLTGTGPFFGALLVSLLAIASGLYFLFHPMVGIMVLVIMVASFLIIEGAFKIVMAFDVRPTKGWGWILVSAAISIILAMLIISGIPETTVYIIGLLLGVNFLMSGIMLMLFAHNIKKAVTTAVTS